MLSRTAFHLALLLLSSCSARNASEVVLVGSTPGDSLIKAMLAIPGDTQIDFIRWTLRLETQNYFVLDIALGESQPNTLGFKKGGENRTMKGTFATTTRGKSGSFAEVYHLKSDRFSGEVCLTKLNENVFHLLTPDNQLMRGNGGWSYSLNRRNPVPTEKILISSAISGDKPLQQVFDGRTPCQEIAGDHPEMNASQSCFKLKWRLILKWDSVNYLPATYTLRKVVDNEPRDVSGKWTIKKGTRTNPNAIIYQLEPDKPGESISFLVGDDNILFFLNQNNELYTGNENFSFTLNRR